jgi:C-terminal processing protease CtpA/Prc
MRIAGLSCALALSFIAFNVLPTSAQQNTHVLSNIDAGKVHAMLHDAYTDTKKYYYDPTFQGVDLEKRYRTFDSMIDKAPDLGVALRIVAGFLGEFHDSHLFFIPPSRITLYDPGYKMQIIGDKCFVTQVRPGSDAAAKLHSGDEILHFAGYNINRADLFDIQYYFHVLAPDAAERLDLKAPDAKQRSEMITMSSRTRKKTLDFTSDNDIWDLIRESQNEDHVTRERLVETEGILFWRMAHFFADESTLDNIFAKARKHPALVLDLRGNPGGSTDTLGYVVGNMFDHDVKIADRVGRKELKPMIGKVHKASFTGKLIVLIDSDSASAAEVFARVVQLEHRGTVIGDTSAGAVMEARHYAESAGADVKVFYGFSITDANLLMADGKSLEHVGVVPDETVTPTAQDIAEGRDPVLARAAELAGTKMDAAEAGKLFPFEWPKN